MSEVKADLNRINEAMRRIFKRTSMAYRLWRHFRLLLDDPHQSQSLQLIDGMIINRWDWLVHFREQGYVMEPEP